MDLRLEAKFRKESNGLFPRLLLAMVGFQLSFGGIVLRIVTLA